MKHLCTLLFGLFVVTSAFAQPGSLDPSFTSGGVNGVIKTIAVQDDGRVLIGGDFTRVNGVIRNYIARLLPSGALDDSFDPGEGPNGPVNWIGIHGQRIFVGGAYFRFDGEEVNGITSLKQDGTIDSSFSAGVRGVVASGVVHQDGIVIVGRGFQIVGGDVSSTTSVARLNLDGSLDSNFRSDIIATFSLNSILVMADGNFLVVGDGRELFNENRVYQGQKEHKFQGVFKILADGTINEAFNPQPVDSSTLWKSAAIQKDGKIILGGIIGGNTAGTIPGLLRLNSDGSVDNTFNTKLQGNFKIVSCLQLQEDGSVLVGGQFSKINNVRRGKIARLTPSGELDLNFNPGDGIGPQAGTDITAVGADKQGRVIIGGVFERFGSDPRNRIARLKSDKDVPEVTLLNVGLLPGVNVDGRPGEVYRIEYTERLNPEPVQWIALETVTLTESSYRYVDNQGVRGEKRYYRAVKLASPLATH